MTNQEKAREWLEKSEIRGWTFMDEASFTALLDETEREAYKRGWREREADIFERTESVLSPKPARPPAPMLRGTGFTAGMRIGPGHERLHEYTLIEFNHFEKDGAEEWQVEGPAITWFYPDDLDRVVSSCAKATEVGKERAVDLTGFGNPHQLDALPAILEQTIKGIGVNVLEINDTTSLQWKPSQDDLHNMRLDELNFSTPQHTLPQWKPGQMLIHSTAKGLHSLLGYIIKYEGRDEDGMFLARCWRGKAMNDMPWGDAEHFHSLTGYVPYPRVGDWVRYSYESINPGQKSSPMQATQEFIDWRIEHGHDTTDTIEPASPPVDTIGTHQGKIPQDVATTNLHPKSGTPENPAYGWAGAPVPGIFYSVNEPNPTLEGPHWKHIRERANRVDSE